MIVYKDYFDSEDQDLKNKIKRLETLNIALSKRIIIIESELQSLSREINILIEDKGSKSAQMTEIQSKFITLEKKMNRNDFNYSDIVAKSKDDTAKLKVEYLQTISDQIEIFGFPRSSRNEYNLGLIKHDSTVNHVDHVVEFQVIVHTCKLCDFDYDMVSEFSGYFNDKYNLQVIESVDNKIKAVAVAKFLGGYSCTRNESAVIKSLKSVYWKNIRPNVYPYVKPQYYTAIDKIDKIFGFSFTLLHYTIILCSILLVILCFIFQRLLTEGRFADFY